jgi:hypothetical protein
MPVKTLQTARLVEGDDGGWWALQSNHGILAMFASKLDAEATLSLWLKQYRDDVFTVVAVEIS